MSSGSDRQHTAKPDARLQPKRQKREKKSPTASEGGAKKRKTATVETTKAAEQSGKHTIRLRKKLRIEMDVTSRMRLEGERDQFHGGLRHGKNGNRPFSVIRMKRSFCRVKSHQILRHNWHHPFGCKSWIQLNRCPESIFSLVIKMKCSSCIVKSHQILRHNWHRSVGL